MSIELLEAACDEVAFAIDDSDGDLISTQINDLVNKALEPFEYSREEFDAAFMKIYLCDVYQYAVNVSDDIEWESSDNEDFDDVDLLDDFEKTDRWFDDYDEE